MIIEQTRFELLPVGEYVAEVTAVDPEEGMYGPQLKFTFTTRGGEHEGQQLAAWTSARFSPKTKLYAWAKAAFNAAIPADYHLNTDDLLGRRVNLTVVIKTKEDGTEFNRIEDVRPYQPKRPVTAPPPSPAPLPGVF